jgi:hypothetical protein
MRGNRQSSLPVSGNALKLAHVTPCQQTRVAERADAQFCVSHPFINFHPLSFSNKQTPNNPHTLTLLSSLFLGLNLDCSTFIACHFCSHVDQHGLPLFQRNLVLHQPARTLPGKHSLHMDRAILRPSPDRLEWLSQRPHLRSRWKVS